MDESENGVLKSGIVKDRDEPPNAEEFAIALAASKGQPLQADVDMVSFPVPALVLNPGQNFALTLYHDNSNDHFVLVASKVGKMGRLGNGPYGFGSKHFIFILLLCLGRL